MTEKRFRVQEHCIRSSYGIEAENWLVTNDNHGVVLNNKAEAHMVANMFNDVIDVLNELNDENIELHIQNDFLKVENQHMRDLIIENKQLKQEIKGLRLSVLDSIHEAEEIQCCCTPCVVEECVKKVIE